jgi:hypothetical protein
MIVIPSKPERQRRRRRGTCCSLFAQTKNAARWPHNSRNLLHSPTPLEERKVYESRVYFSRHARVERTPSSAASDFDLDFDREGHEFHSCQSASNTRNPESAARRYAQPRCHPERSMRIRFMDPHAQSKSLPRAKPRGSLPCCSCLSRLREFSRNRRAVGAVA